MHDAKDHRQQSWLEIVWALVLLQGGFLIVNTLESLVVNLGFGFVMLPVLMLTAGASVLTLWTARGLRMRRRWARRVTLVGEWFVLAIGALELVATLALTGGLPPLIPITTSIVIPIGVLVFLRRTRPLFERSPQPGKDEPSSPADDAVLGTLA